jgi:hypothetical protein
MKSTVSAHPSSRGRFILGLCVGVLLGFAACYSLGYFVTSYHPIEESKLCYLALTDHPERLQPQTREYLKARLYSNAAFWVRRSWMAGWHLDFGPVDDSALGGLIAIKDAESTAEIYQAALAKHGITPKPK